MWNAWMNGIMLFDPYIDEIGERRGNKKVKAFF